ncbi:MAG TPA: hypothetical protein VK808_07265 [Bacteroidia bacterium]|nr:hypothetical protein [Bacteroidia bacterium]
MKEITQSKFVQFFYASLALTVICAWFSIGFHQADEHFQVLEFCNYKLGHLSFADSPWELQQKVRSTLLPDIAFLLVKGMDVIGLFNPFIVAFILRFIAGILSWFIVCKLCVLLAPQFKTRQGEKLFILMSLFLWFVPYLSVRFTAENVSGVVFLYGVYAILRHNEKASSCILAGLLFGISFFIRFQFAFAIIGLVAWLFFIKKTKVKFIFIMALSAMVAIGFNVLLDYWFYGQWVFTPFNYFYINIVQHKAAYFGVMPWWFYIPEFLMEAVPPISVFLAIAFIYGIAKNIKNPFVWIIIPFIASHFFIGHKEMRFLFPIVFIFIYCCAIGIDSFLAKNIYQKTFRFIYKLSIIICIPVLIYRTLIPAQVPVSYSEYLYHNSASEGNTLLVLNKDCDMTINGLFSGFYKAPGMSIVKIDSVQQVKKYMEDNGLKSALFFYKENNDLSTYLSGYKTEVAYCFFPAWLLKFDINHWVERSAVWKFYRINKS